MVGVTPSDVVHHTHLVATHGYQSTPLQWVLTHDQSGTGSSIVRAASPISMLWATHSVLWLGLVALITQIKKIVVYPSSLFTSLPSSSRSRGSSLPALCSFITTSPARRSYVSSCHLGCQSIQKYLLLILLLSSISLLLISPLLYGFATPSAYWDMVFAF